jgi:hypothetical protein
MILAGILLKKKRHPPIVHTIKWRKTEPHLPIQSDRLNIALRAGA